MLAARNRALWRHSLGPRVLTGCSGAAALDSRAATGVKGAEPRDGKAEGSS